MLRQIPLLHCVYYHRPEVLELSKATLESSDQVLAVLTPHWLALISCCEGCLISTATTFLITILILDNLWNRVPEI